MRRFVTILLLFAFSAVSCIREVVDEAHERYPDGSHVTMTIPFFTQDGLDVQMGTKAEADSSDETRVHDVFVLLFDKDGNRFYKYYFTYEHMVSTISVLDSQKNDAWYVNHSGSGTVGAVKLATESKKGCTLVVIANVANTISSLDGKDAVSRLSEITTLAQLKTVKVTLEQEVVNRSDLFLRVGVMEGVDTGSIKWGVMDGGTPEYTEVDGHKQVQLKAVDAKVKFHVTYNTTNFNVDKCSPRYWKVFNAPSSCYLFEQDEDPEDVTFFNTGETYFEGTETTTKDEVTTTWQVFTFYMLENRQSINVPRKIEPVNDYYLRELQEKDDNPDYPEGEYVTNGKWVHAPEDGTYVQFDIVLNLTVPGIQEILSETDAKHALTSEALFTVHLGDFSEREGHPRDLDNYDVKRGHEYNYYVTVQNSKKIYVEVMGDPDEEGHPQREDQPGQEGSLLLATDELVNCDAHYESHSLTFVYTEGITGSGVSWYVKTPFGEGGAVWKGSDWEFECKDYLWVKFSINDTYVDGESKEHYQSYRMAYPGDGAYDPTWTPDSGDPPELMDIHQLILYIFDQTAKEDAGLESAFRDSGKADNPETLKRHEDREIRVTAFIEEFYYEKDPRTYEYLPGSQKVDPDSGELVPDLWREFVNAQPRELHVLSDARYSKDRMSDVITSSHSIIQQSIQSFYNIYSPDLNSLWGVEHKDEMSYASRVVDDPSCTAWDWWPSERALPTGTTIYPTSEENGRQNSASLWGLYSGTDQEWDTYLDYNKDNTIPQLEPDYQYLAYSCLTRNRDIDGDGIIDPEEMRWYTASINQLVGMWVGNESLSISSRLYNPKDASSKGDGLEWRSWGISSTVTGINNDKKIIDTRVVRGEEGATKSIHSDFKWAFEEGSVGADKRNKVSAIRCVRNIGTFQKEGATTDISYAPYDWIVDQYYEIPAGTDGNGKARPNADGTYTIRFSRLNPKSIREYAENDLPSHTEYSVHNCVYLEMTMQSRDNYVYADGSFPAHDEETINENVTNKGYNEYCPTGYRLPTMTELLMMNALMPSSYWSSSTKYPCRTYFSRGKKGNKVTSTEENKIGWMYNTSSGRVNMVDDGVSITGIRCVRDRNSTGEINGKVIVLDGDKLQLSTAQETRKTVIKLNFSSNGSAITNFALTLVYVDTDGVEGLIEIPTTGVELSGVNLIQDIEWELPEELPVLGNLAVRASLRNSAGVSRTFETPVRILSPIFTSVRLMHCEYNEGNDTPPFPVLLTASSPSEDITGVKLHIHSPDGDFVTVDCKGIFGIGTGEKRYWSHIYNYVYTLASLELGTYRFQLEVNTATRSSRSEYATMDVLKVNYCPNPTPETPWAVASDITGKWERQEIKGMDFYAGDFVEANMDISACTYKLVEQSDPTKRDDNKSIWRDNLISVGLADTDYGTSFTVPNVLHIYYPDHDNKSISGDGNDWLRVGFITKTKSALIYTYNTSFSTGDGTGFVIQDTKVKPNTAANQHFRIDKNGVFWNHQKMDLSLWGAGASDARETFEKLLTANTLYVGSTQGVHRSRATYHFVRAVHNSVYSNATGGDNSNFDDNPVNGGEL